MPTPSLTPAFVLSTLTTIVALFLTQGLIDNATEKFVTGLASVLIPVAFAIAHSLFQARVHAAKITASTPSSTPRKKSTSR